MDKKQLNKTDILHIINLYQNLKNDFVNVTEAELIAITEEYNND